MFTVPIMLYPTIAHNFVGHWLLARSSETSWRRLAWRVPLYAAMAAVLIVALYLPILMQTGGWTNLTANRWVEPLTSFGAWQHGLWKLIGDLSMEWSLGLSKPGLAIVVVFAAIGISVGITRRDWRPAWIIIAALTCVGLMAAQRVIPFARVFSFALPMFLLMAGLGISTLISTRRAPSLAMALCVGLGLCVVIARDPDRSSAFDKFPLAHQGDRVPFAAR